MKRLLYFLCIALAFSVYSVKTDFFIEKRVTGTTYYVTPSTSIATVNTWALKGGDSVFFQRGGTWTGTLDLSGRTGDHGNPIYIGAYGSGAKPVITTRSPFPGWQDVTKWTQYGTNQWKFTGVYANPNGKTHRIWLDGVEARRARTDTGISAANKASYLSDYYELWVYAPSNPATFYSSIEFPGDATATVGLYSAAHIVLQDLDLRGSSGGTIALSNATHIDILNDDVGRDAGHIGISGFNLTDSITITGCRIISGDEIKDYFQFQHGLQDGIAMNAGCHNWTVENNDIENWGHSCVEFTTALQDNTGKTKNGYTMSNAKIWDNLLKAPLVDYCRPFGFDTDSAHLTTGISARYNRADSFPVRCQLETAGMDFSYNVLTNFYNLGVQFAGVENTGQAIMITGYSGTNPKNMTIVGNTIVNTQEAGITIATSTGYKGASGNLIANNLLLNCATAPMYGYHSAHLVLLLKYGWEQNTFRNNLAYRTGETQLFYDERRGSAAWMTLADFNGANGTSIGVVSGNVSADPLLTSATDCSLLSGSPCIATGYDLGTSYKSAISPLSSWPNSVVNADQSTLWNIGAYTTAALTGQTGGGSTLTIKRKVKTR